MHNWTVEKDLARVVSVTLDMETEDDEYSMSPMTVIYAQGDDVYDRISTDIGILDYECYPYVREVVEWLEKWDGRKVCSVTVVPGGKTRGPDVPGNPRLVGFDGDEKFLLWADTRQGPGTRINRKLVRGSMLPDSVGLALDKWMEGLLDAIGTESRYEGL